MSQAPGPHFRLEDIDGVTVVRLVGPKLVVDAGGPLYDLVEQGGRRNLLLDFAGIQFLSSAALGELRALLAPQGTSGCTHCAASRPVCRVRSTEACTGRGRSAMTPSVRTPAG